jgi:hypothetical protein
MVESTTNISVQQFVDKTQDTQDSFSASVAPSPTQVVAENEIKATDLKSSVLSCPEFDDDAQDQELMGIPEDSRTQDNCPEFVLSCPEFVLSCPDLHSDVNAICASQQRFAITPANSEEEEANPMETEEAIADLAGILELCDSKELLSEIRSTDGFTPSALKLASKRLSPDKSNQIKKWVIELDQIQSPSNEGGSN